MRPRHSPKVIARHNIQRNRKDIGYIQLVNYMTGKAVPHLEYEIIPEYRNQGIMSIELPRYLKYRKRYEDYQMLAVIKKDNYISEKLLKNNGFVQLLELDDKLIYIIDLRITPEIARSSINKMQQDFNVPIEYD